MNQHRYAVSRKTPIVAVLAVLALSIPGRAQQIISTFAGNGAGYWGGDGGPATEAGLVAPDGLAIDGQGNVYVCDAGNLRIRKITPAGTISTVAGNGNILYAGDGGQAVDAPLFINQSYDCVAVDSAGNVYIADTGNNRVRKVGADGIISTVAGNGFPFFAGDGGKAVDASVAHPTAVFVDTRDNLYIVDSLSLRIRKVDTSGMISTVVGGGPVGFNGDGGPATKAGISGPVGFAVDKDGNMYIADFSYQRVRKVDTNGIINTIGGNGMTGYTGDNGPALNATFAGPEGVGVDDAGNVYVTDRSNNCIRKIDTSGMITTFAGGAPPANFRGADIGDGNAPANSLLSLPNGGVRFDALGNMYIPDSNHQRIRKVSVPPPATPSISANGIVNGASFEPGIAANGWATIAGTNLASTTATWDKAIINGKLPTTLAGVSVSVGGKTGYIDYVSATQINFVVPDVAAGPVKVTVTNTGATSAEFTVNAGQFGPAFFPWPSNQVVATHLDYTFTVRDGTFAGLTTIPAKPGEIIILWGTGFGPTSPAAPSGMQLPADQTYSTATLPEVTVNNVPAKVYGAALAPGFAALYQVAIEVPGSLGDGDWVVQASIGGQKSPATAILSVRK